MNDVTAVQRDDVSALADEQLFTLPPRAGEGQGRGHVVASVATAGQSNPPSGWHASLDLRFAARNGRTYLSERVHRGPLCVQRPFYPEGDVCHVYIVHPPGGVVGGDELSIGAQLDDGCHALITTPAAAKFYRSENLTARQTQHVQTRAATIEWLPQETIFYPGAKVRSETRISLQSHARFIGWEIACLGLPARAEPFARGDLRLAFELEIDAMPRWIDRLHIDGKADPRTARWGFAGYAALGTLLAYPAPRELLDLARSIEEPDVETSATLVDDVLVYRALAMQAEPLRHTLTRIWETIRPPLLGIVATVPRIWRT